ncbi:MAG: heme exporter protein CcmB [Proteobacteria bacterium]|nr:heme exporter protein CcmB [Pseudomonadota bacterium]
MSFPGKVFNIAAKDFRVELRSKERLYSMMIFSLLVMVIFNFAFDPGAEYIREVAPGILWVALIFSATLGLNKTFAAEKDQDCLQGLMLAPMDRSGIYFGKLLGNLVLSLIISGITLPFFSIFFNIPIVSSLPQLLFVIFLAILGFITVGTLFAAISVGVKGGEMMLPLLLFPVEVPVIIAAVKATGMILDGKLLIDYSMWLKMLAIFDVIFIVVSYVAFEYLIEE